VQRRLGEHLAAIDPAAAGAFASASEDARRAACQIVQDKAQTLAEVWPLVSFLFTEPEPDPAAWDRVMDGEAARALRAAHEALRTADAFDPASIEATLAPVVAELGVKPKAVYQPIRVAITGGTVSPGIFESLSALGRERSLARIAAALSRLDGHGPAGG